MPPAGETHLGATVRRVCHSLSTPDSICQEHDLHSYRVNEACTQWDDLLNVGSLVPVDWGATRSSSLDWLFLGTWHPAMKKLRSNASYVRTRGRTLNVENVVACLTIVSSKFNQSLVVLR